MIYVYVKNNRIYAKKEARGSYPGCMEICCGYNISDDLIYEDNSIKLYEESKQYRKDKHLQTLEEENKKLQKENGSLKKLANREIKSKLRIKEERDLTDYDRQKYFSIYGN